MDEYNELNAQLLDVFMPNPSLKNVWHASAPRRLDQPVAEQWRRELERKAAAENRPIVAIIDASELHFVTAGAAIVLAQLTRQRWLNGFVFIASKRSMQGALQMVAMLSAHDKVFVFSSLEAAQAFILMLVTRAA
ncbi:MAG: hypothetical protein SNJ59_10675 [Aggregatilineales bacterium]